MPLEPNHEDIFSDTDSGTSYWGSQAAGCIFVAKDTGRILLAHRSDRVDFEPDTWGTWGGKVDGDETPKDAVQREIEEETGFNGTYKVHPLYVYKDGNFEYHNYLIVVPFEFTPQLNWENQGSAWVEYGDWPEPLHFGMEALIRHSGTKIERIIQLLKRKKDMMTEIDAPPAIHQSVHSFDKDFVQYMKQVENAAKVGFKNGKWFPHKSPEGGMETIGYGHKIKNRPELERMMRGISDSEVERLLIDDLQIAFSQVKSDIQKMFNVQVPLDQVQEEILIDYAFNLGNIRGFPKFVKAVLNKDWQTAKKEYIRTYKDAKGNRKELGRNKAFANRYLKESDDAVQVVPQGLLGIGLKSYKWVTPYGYLAYAQQKGTNQFYLLMVQIKPEFRNKGYSKMLVRKFFEYMKTFPGSTLNPGSYTMSGMAWLKHVLERFSKEFGIRLVNGWHPQDV